MDEQIYSFDNEIFHDDIDYVLDCAAENEQQIIFVGYKTLCKHSQFIDVDNLIEVAQENAFVNFPENHTDGYLEDVTKEILTQLKQLISDFLNEKIGQPEFYGVINVKEVHISEFE